MVQIHVNGLPRSDRSGPENWGDLLNSLENGEGAGRHVVTAVRFGGVAVPTFREPPTLARDLQELGPIEVETATVDELLHESAQAAYDSISPLRNASRRIAERLRDGHTRASLRDLPQLTTSVMTLTGVTSSLARAGDNAGAYRADLDALVVRLCAVVDAIIERQALADWRGVADVLDNELGPTLAAWSSVVRRVWAV